AETVEERELRLEHRRNNWKKKRTTETTNKYNEHNCEYLSSETD
ncbi:9734_t:CDS:1, partial [Dentiscutata heterogama]